MVSVRRLAVAALLFAGCGDDPAPPVTATFGDLTVEVYPAPARVVIRDMEGRALLDGLPGGRVEPGREAIPRVGLAARRATATYEHRFGSFKIEEVEAEDWLAVARITDIIAGDSNLSFDLVDAGGAVLGNGVIAAEESGVISIGYEFPGFNRASMAIDCAVDEHFLGLGGQSYDVDHRGQTVPLWVQEDGIGKGPDDFYDFGIWFFQGRRHSTHTPMPIYLSSRGYALALDTPYRSIFAMCSEDEKVVRVEAWESTMRFRFFHGPEPLTAITRLTAWTGRPALPPKFTFAPWLDAIYGSANVRRVAQQLRANGVAASAIWSEDWRGGTDTSLGYTLDEDWEVDRDVYPDFEAVADDLHAAGYKFLIYFNTFLDSTVGTYQEAVAGGHTIKDSEGNPYLFDGVKFEKTSLADLSSETAHAWVKQKHRDGLELGADGYMADFCEWLPTDAVLASGEDALARHNLYPVDYQRLNQSLMTEMYAEDGIERLFFVRSAYLGSQPLVSVVWAGDQQTDFSLGDGYPSVIPMGIGLGVTGFPYFGHDIAGYMSQNTAPTTRELFFRWVTLGALSPVMRTHHGRSARENHNWESDAETTAHMARWTQFHQRLFPYLYGLAKIASELGTPMMRPMALDFPSYEPGWRATDQFMLGDRLFVAPVIQEGATSRTLLLPPGTYYPVEGGPAMVSTGEALTVEAPVSEIPTLVRAGTLLPMLPPGVDTVLPVDPASGLTTLADVGDDRHLWLWPGGSSKFTEANELSYAWDGTMLTARPTKITRGATEYPLAVGDGYVEAVLPGPGTYQVDEGVLLIDRGAADRAITVRVFDP